MDALHSLRVDKTAIIVSPLSAPSNDREYWLSRSPYERLQAVESLRQLNYGHGQSTSRLQRVLEVTVDLGPGLAIIHCGNTRPTLYTIIMIGATVFTLATADVALALIPLVVGLLSVFIAYDRWCPVP